MIFGRPTNLWLGFTTAFVGFVSLVAVTVFKVDPTVVSTVGGGATVLLGAGISLIAGQPPTVNPGDRITVTTPTGQPNYQTTIATPPKQDPPPVPAT
jgi:hypothetical protein